MGKKKRSHPDVEDILSRPWCYYCERDFEDLKLLISHQKAKHFKCDRCGRRLNTAGGLAVHMNQVHKETLTEVENALPNRQGLDVEIFGMEGIPADILDQHRTRIVQNYYQAQEDRRIATGNVQPGQQPGVGRNPPRKKLRIETPEELTRRLAEHRAKVQAAKAAGLPPPGTTTTPTQNSAEFNASFPPPQPYGEQQQFQQAGYSQPPPGAYPPAYTQASSLPARPTAPPGLPQRPSYPPGGNFWSGPGAPPSGYAGAENAGAPGGDDIDQLIRMAEAGIKPPPSKKAEEEAGGEKKSKKDKDKNSRMVYSDPDEISPEERMAMLPRYAFAAA